MLLAADPPVLLMDEPFSAVDPIVRASLQDELLRLQAELHKTVVFVTHDIEEAIKVGDQVAIFRPHGKLAQVDSPQRLLAAPVDSYVEDFIGFDRGIRRLSFLAADTLDLDTAARSPARTARPREALAQARKAGASWLLVVDSERLPRGWVAAAELESAPGDTKLADVRLTAGHGHTFRVDYRFAARRAGRHRAVRHRPGRRRGRRRPGGRRDLLRPAAGGDPARGRRTRGGGRASPMSWALSNASMLAHLTGQNAYLALVPVLVGLVISLPLGIVSVRWGWLYPPVLSITSVLYALPALALFVALIAYTGLTDTTVMIPLSVYSLAVLFPSVVDGLRSVPEPVRQAAVAMGFGTWRRLATVELPIATPVVIAGLRVAAVSSISLVSVGQLIGIGGLGYLFIDGEQRDFTTEIVVGIVLIIVLVARRGLRCSCSPAGC